MITPFQARQIALLSSYKKEKKFWDEVIDLKIQAAAYTGSMQCEVDFNPSRSVEEIQNLTIFADYQFDGGYEITGHQDDDGMINKIVINFDQSTVD